MVITSPGRAGAEQGLAVVAAEQEGEPVQILAQLGGVVGGVTDELLQGRRGAPVAGQPPAEELQQLGELGRVYGVDGIKTGYTRASGFNLLTSVHRDGRSLIAVVMGGRTSGARNRIMENLIADHIA